MGTERGDRPLDLPAFASVRSENGVTELRVRVIFSRWFKRYLWAIPILFFAILIAVSVIATATRDEASGLPAWVIALNVVAGLFLFGLFILGLALLIAAQMVGEMVFDGKTLHIKDHGVRTIPLDRIRAIRQVIDSRSRLEIDSTGPPSRVFSRSRRSWVEIEVPEGRLRCFGFFGQLETRWLAVQAHRLCFANEDAEAPTITLDPKLDHDDDVVMPSRIYGRPRRLLIATGLLSGFVFAAISGWFIYLGLSSNTWPQTQGRVEHSLYEETRNGRNTSYKTELRYSYKVFGATYTNEDLGFGHDASDNIVKQTITQHPDGSVINVYYNPVRPGQSVVIPGVGFIHWFVMGGGVLMMLLTLPMALRRTTATQDALSRLYKSWTRSPRINQFDELASTLRWTVPEHAFTNAVQTMRRTYRWMALRTTVLCGMAVWAAYHWFAPLCPPDFPWRKLALILLALYTLPWAALLLYLHLARFKPGTYSVGPSGVSTPSSERPLIRWNDIASFTIQPDEQQPGHRVVRLHRHDGSTRFVTLPEGDAAHDIVHLLGTRLPQSPPPVQASPLSKGDWITGLVIVAVVIAVGGEVLSRSVRIFHGDDTVQWILLLVMIVGPGTWTVLVMRRRRAVNALLPLAAMMNLFSSIGLVVFAMMRHLLQGK